MLKPKSILIFIICLICFVSTGCTPKKDSTDSATSVTPTPTPIHTHTYTETVVEPTVKKSGYTIYKCDCGYEYTGNTTEKLAWKDVFLSYMKKNADTATDEKYTIEKTYNSENSIYQILTIIYFVEFDEIRVNYSEIVKDNGTTTMASIFLKNVREKYSVGYIYRLCDAGEYIYTAIGDGLVEAKEIYNVPYITFDNYHQSVSMNWKAKQQKETAKLLRSLCKTFDKELPAFGADMDLTYWNIVY